MAPTQKPEEPFNIEHDQFPYEDGSFDILLFCEILEHLLSDPVHALIEIRRVLKDGGLLVLSTPNVAGLGDVGKLIAGQNIYEPYSGYGPHGRHNREYTRDELFRLLSANGFQVKTLFTADVRNVLSHPPHRIRRHQASGEMPGARPGGIHLLPEHCEPERKVAASGTIRVALQKLTQQVSLDPICSSHVAALQRSVSSSK